MLGRSARENRARPVEAVNRRHFALEKAQVASIEITGCKGRRRPGIAVRTDNIQGSHLVAAVARSRSKKQSLGGVRRRVRNNGFCYNCRCIAALLSRAGRSLGRAEARKHPAVARRAPQAAPAPPRQPYFVILSVSEGSIWGKVTDSSSIFRSPQNDNAVFALNHFLSGTHSSARPGRLRGSHL